VLRSRTSKDHSTIPIAQIEEGMDSAMIVDEAELGQLAALIVRLSPGQQQLVAALADGSVAAGWSRCSGSGPGGAAT